MQGTGLIATAEDLDRALEESSRVPVFVFKHSLTCVPSAWSLRTYEKFAAAVAPGAARFLRIEIQRTRDVSDELARRTGVRHESPQVILLRDGGPVWNGSHWEITEKAMQKALEGAES